MIMEKNINDFIRNYDNLVFKKNTGTYLSNICDFQSIDFKSITIKDKNKLESLVKDFYSNYDTLSKIRNGLFNIDPHEYTEFKSAVEITLVECLNRYISPITLEINQLQVEKSIGLAKKSNFWAFLSIVLALISIIISIAFNYNMDSKIDSIIKQKINYEFNAADSLLTDKDMIILVDSGSFKFDSNDLSPPKYK